MREKRSQVETNFLTWLKNENGRKINLKIINSRAKRGEWVRVRWKLLPYNVSIVCAVTWKVFSFHWILISNKGWKIYGMIIKNFCCLLGVQFYSLPEHNDWFLIFRASFFVWHCSRLNIAKMFRNRRWHFGIIKMYQERTEVVSIVTRS